MTRSVFPPCVRRNPLPRAISQACSTVLIMPAFPLRDIHLRCRKSAAAPRWRRAELHPKTLPPLQFPPTGLLLMITPLRIVRLRIQQPTTASRPTGHRAFGKAGSTNYSRPSPSQWISVGQMPIATPCKPMKRAKNPFRNRLAIKHRKIRIRDRKNPPRDPQKTHLKTTNLEILNLLRVPMRTSPIFRKSSRRHCVRGTKALPADGPQPTSA